MFKIRHQVAIAGRVTCSHTQEMLPSAVLTVSGNGIKRNASPAPDGLYYFLDLPDGEYLVEASALNGKGRYGAASGNAHVSRTPDEQGERIVPAIVDLVLRQTTVKGRVMANKSPVVLAQVRVKGSGEAALTDSQGQYLLAGIEKGARTIQVFSQNYAPAEKAVKLQTPGSVVELNFTLARA
jgi:hypothetical protein